MKYHSLFLLKILGQMSQNLSSAAVVIGGLKAKNSMNIMLYTSSLNMLCKNIGITHVSCSINQLLPGPR